MKKFLWLLMCLIASTSYSQIKLSGNVLDGLTKEKLESAIVSIPELKRASTTDVDAPV